MIERHDRRYHLALTKGSRSRSWILTRMRAQSKRSAPTAMITWLFAFVLSDSSVNTNSLDCVNLGWRIA